MEINLDQAMAVAEVRGRDLKWELTIVIGGIRFAVKPITIDQMSSIAAAQGLKEIAAVRELLLSLLDGADGSAIKDEQIGTALLAIALAFQEHIKKKSLILADSIQREIVASTAMR